MGRYYKCSSKVRWETVDGIHLAQDGDTRWALANMVMDLRFPQIAGNFFTSEETNSSSRRALFHGVQLVSGITKHLTYTTMENIFLKV